MEVIKKGETFTTRDVIINLKSLYDLEGAEGIAALSRKLLSLNKNKRVAELALFIIQVGYYMGSCTSTCFENIDERSTYCRCTCKEPFFIPFVFEEVSDQVV